MTIHQSVTASPVNWETCGGCREKLPPKQPRLYQVRIPDGRGEHRHSFWCRECVGKKLNEEGGAA